ncbi:hypothetical protein NUBL22003_50110 [Klebsiella pneumoniae]|nr:hypothetical protein NUBL22003_50110 [Klebsiella pneumoniae]
MIIGSLRPVLRQEALKTDHYLIWLTARLDTLVKSVRTVTETKTPGFFDVWRQEKKPGAYKKGKTKYVKTRRI